MKLSQKLFFCILLAVSVVGCKKQRPEPPIEPVVKKIPITISTSITKVSGDSFETGDAIGLFVVNATPGAGSDWKSVELSNSGNHLDNVKFTYNGSWQSDKQYYWKDDKTPADFYCYYPYNNGITDVKSVTYTIPSDQSKEDAFKSCEILWGLSSLQKPSLTSVNITTTHRMSQIEIAIRPGKGFTEETLAKSLSAVTVNGIICGAQLNLKDGSLNATGTQTDITPYFDGSVYRAFIVPQAINAKPLVTLTIDGLERILTQTVEFTSGSRKKCTITVDKLTEGVNVSIGGWETDNIDYGGTLK